MARSSAIEAIVSVSRGMIELFFNFRKLGVRKAQRILVILRLPATTTELEVWRVLLLQLAAELRSLALLQQEPPVSELARDAVDQEVVPEGLQAGEKGRDALPPFGWECPRPLLNFVDG